MVVEFFEVETVVLVIELVIIDELPLTASKHTPAIIRIIIKFPFIDLILSAFPELLAAFIDVLLLVVPKLLLLVDW